MKQIRWIVLLSFFILVFLSACSGGEAVIAQTANEHSDAASGMNHMHVQAPEEFTTLVNPFVDDHEAIEAGEATFNTLCATCHGQEGKGDGPASAGLDPKPADLSDGTMMHDLSDGYLFWRVTKGGQMEPFNSAMPAWGDGLSEEQRWQVIAFLRTLADDSPGHIDDGHMDDGHTDDGHTDDAQG